MSTVRFSRRTSWPSEENALSLAITERRRAGLSLLDLTASNPTTVGLPFDPGAILGPLADPRALVYQPDSLGIPVAREAVARFYAQRSLVVDPSRVVITASSSESYAFLFSLLADPGDEILIPSPSYPLLSFLADLSDVRLVPYHLSRHDGWRPDTSLELAITERTRAIVTVSPNNPTGSYLDEHDLGRLIDVAAERGLALIQDEVFSEYPFDIPGPTPSLATQRRCLSFVLNGLSKAAALPQMKLGWIVASGPEPLVFSALDRLALIADTYLSVATPVQLALPSLLDAATPVVEAIRARTRRNLMALRAAFDPPHPARVLPVQAGWYATLHVPNVLTDEAWALRALERGVLVQPGHFYDVPSSLCALVISLLTPEATFEEGVAVLAEMLS